MKHIIKLVFVFLFSITINAQNHHGKDKPSVHGMLLMGTSTIYASHLPMFHSPHDYQIIISLNFSKNDNDIYVKDRITYPNETVYTLAPEVFVLPEKIHEKDAAFKATIYRGHFERGGKKILENIDVSIEKIIYFKKFEIETKRPEKLRYFLFGNESEQFLAHVISKRPDFDEVLSIQLKKKNLSLLNNTNYIILEGDENDVRKPYSWANKTLLNVGTDKNLKIKKPKTLYLEYGDLD